MTCPIYPEKVRKTNIVDALDGLLQRMTQPRSHIARTYKCPGCHGWHYTKRRPNFIIADPFPRPYLYGVVRPDDTRYWQSNDQGAAERYAKEHGGRVVPFMESRYKHRERMRHEEPLGPTRPDAAASA